MVWSLGRVWLPHAWDIHMCMWPICACWPPHAWDVHLGMRDPPPPLATPPPRCCDHMHVDCAVWQGVNVRLTQLWKTLPRHEVPRSMRLEDGELALKVRHASSGVEQPTCSACRWDKTVVGEAAAPRAGPGAGPGTAVVISTLPAALRHVPLTLDLRIDPRFRRGRAASASFATRGRSPTRSCRACIAASAQNAAIGGGGQPTLPARLSLARSAAQSPPTVCGSSMPVDSASGLRGREDASSQNVY